MSERLDVKKTLKLYVNGAFIRSESGRSYEVLDSEKKFYANAALASRKDLRDAVKAARDAQSSWQNLTAYNRGQILYRLAEMCETRRTQLEEELIAIDGLNKHEAAHQVSVAIDRLIWYAGWSDKVSSVYGGHNQVASPYFNFSVIEPTGVIGIIADSTCGLLSLVSLLAPALTTGNSCVVIAAEANPVIALTFAEIIATSDVPAGVINILTGDYKELGVWLAEHLDVDGLDLTGVHEHDLAQDFAKKASVNVKRVFPLRKLDWLGPDETSRLRFWTETKTVWHPIGS